MDEARELEWLRRVRDLSHQLAVENDLGELLPKILDSAIELTNAERGFLVEVRGRDESTDRYDLKVAVARGFNRSELADSSASISQGVVQRVLKDETDGLATSSHENVDLLERSSIKASKVLSILCVPMRVRGEVRGVLYLDHRFAPDLFGPEDLPLVRAFGDHAALAMETAELAERATASGPGRPAPSSGQLVGESPVMKALSEEIDQAARSRRPVLLLGEGGVGKQLVGREIHARSERAAEPFVEVACAGRDSGSLASEILGHRRGAFPWATSDRRGVFVVAGKGTLYLEEPEAMSQELQAQVQGALRNHEVHEFGGPKARPIRSRLIVGTEADLRGLAEIGAFRKDLYFELDVLRLIVPPLRQRRSDIPLLIEHFAARGGRLKLSAKALALLKAYAWPGNVRELENEVGRLIEAGLKIVEPEHLSLEIQEGEGVGGGEHVGKTLGEVEREMVRAALSACEGNKAHAARQLGIPRSSLYALLDRHGLR